QVGPEAGNAPVRERGRPVRAGARPEAVDDPHPGPGDLVRVQPGPHEDRTATTTRADLHEVAGDALLAQAVERRVEVVELPLPLRGVGEERGGRGVVRA